MPYLPTPQAYLEQSALLLQAYPDSRITTKYSFPSQRPTALKKAQARQSQRQQQQQQQTQDASTTQSTTQTPVATLTLKTYNPYAGICLQYRTNKAAEVGRLITSLGKLAGGADVAALGLGAAAATAGAAPGGDVEMTDAPVATEEAAPAQAAGQQAQGKPDAGTKGGKSKKKGKGKR
ncbi:SRP9/SRP21 family protein [Aspergillus ruber CBS 135680]|uniref:SRP9 domain-containing protein n=1 Tax=Aspergillus ruber (strain CBS 135680) TaxID=1388766 RepID=A0A017SB00_ASPRC|nr:uncharacterized protein EURHEDRAFT_403793 [Aspergillus ruber CBS 135680]EYE94087.1 hypothetical protein EURHEDRAFT_403793 [Aspergillus ruber CBS 135680]